jgi:hypothetical protein
LADIDAPEFGELGFNESLSFLENLVENRTVYIDVDDISRTDPFDRFICLVFLEWNSTHYLNVNQALLNENHAILYDFTDNEFDPYSWQLYYSIAQIIPEFSLPALLLLMGIMIIILLLFMKSSKEPKNITKLSKTQFLSFKI